MDEQETHPAYEEGLGEEPKTPEELEEAKKAAGVITTQATQTRKRMEEHERSVGIKEEEEKNTKIFKEIKEGFYENHSELTSITNEAAEGLSKYEGDIHLDKLTSLSDQVAESLSKFRGNLFLRGLTSLSDQAAESLSKLKRFFSLDGLTSLSDQAAESLSKHEGGAFSLKGLTSLSDQAAESLSKHEGFIHLPDNLRRQVNKFKKD